MGELQGGEVGHSSPKNHSGAYSLAKIYSFSSKFEISILSQAHWRSTIPFVVNQVSLAYNNLCSCLRISSRSLFPLVEYGINVFFSERNHAHLSKQLLNMGLGSSHAKI